MQDGVVINPKRIPPDRRPFGLGDIPPPPPKVLRWHDQKRVEMRMRRAVPCVRYLSRPNPAEDRSKLLPFRKALPSFAHSPQRGSEFGNWNVLLSERKEKRPRFRVSRQQARGRLKKPRHPHQRPPPLAYGTVPYPAKLSGSHLQCEHAGAVLFRTPGERENLGARPDALAETRKPTGVIRVQVNRRNLVRLRPMSVPRFVFRTAFGEVLRLFGRRFPVCIAARIAVWYTQTVRCSRHRVNLSDSKRRRSNPAPFLFLRSVQKPASDSNQCSHSNSRIVAAWRSRIRSAAIFTRGSALWSASCNMRRTAPR